MAAAHFYNVTGAQELDSPKRLNQSVNLLLSHAMREEIIGESLCIIHCGQLRLVGDVGIVHQASVEPQ